MIKSMNDYSFSLTTKDFFCSFTGCLQQKFGVDPIPCDEIGGGHVGLDPIPTVMMTMRLWAWQFIQESTHHRKSTYESK